MLTERAIKTLAYCHPNNYRGEAVSAANLFFRQVDGKLGRRTLETYLRIRRSDLLPNLSHAFGIVEEEQIKQGKQHIPSDHTGSVRSSTPAPGEASRRHHHGDTHARPHGRFDPTVCPGLDWHWVRSHVKKSRTGTEYTVRGHWRRGRVSRVKEPWRYDTTVYPGPGYQWIKGHSRWCSSKKGVGRHIRVRGHWKRTRAIVEKTFERGGDTYEAQAA